MSPKHARGARVVFLEPAATQLRSFTMDELALLDTAVDDIARRPDAAKPHRTAPALRDHQGDSVRVIYYATALGSIVIVVYVEADEEADGAWE